jgi:hypothetical protein
MLCDERRSRSRQGPRLQTPSIVSGHVKTRSAYPERETVRVSASVVPWCPSLRASQSDQLVDRPRSFGYQHAPATGRPCGYPRSLAVPTSPPCAAGHGARAALPAMMGTVQQLLGHAGAGHTRTPTGSSSDDARCQRVQERAVVRARPARPVHPWRFASRAGGGVLGALFLAGERLARARMPRHAGRGSAILTPAIQPKNIDAA